MSGPCSYRMPCAACEAAPFKGTTDGDCGNSSDDGGCCDNVNYPGQYGCACPPKYEQRCEMKDKTEFQEGKVKKGGVGEKPTTPPPPPPVGQGGEAVRWNAEGAATGRFKSPPPEGEKREPLKDVNFLYVSMDGVTPLKCPVCGSNEVKVKVSKGYVPVVDSDEKVPFTEEVITCGKCHKSVMGDQRVLVEAIKVAKALSIKAILNRLKEKKVASLAYYERVLHLKAGTLKKWEAGEPVSDAEFILLKIIRAHPGLLKWADDEGWKDQIVTTIELDEADSKMFTEALTNPPMPNPVLKALFEKYDGAPERTTFEGLGYRPEVLNGTPVYVGPPVKVDEAPDKPKGIPCPSCNGSGLSKFQDTLGLTKTCEQCGGAGVKPKDFPVAHNQKFGPSPVAGAIAMLAMRDALVGRKPLGEYRQAIPLTFEEFVKQEFPEFKHKKVWIEDGDGHPISHSPEAHILTEDDRHIVIPLSDVLLRSGKTSTASSAMAEQMIKSPSMGAVVEPPPTCSLCEKVEGKPIPHDLPNDPNVKDWIDFSDKPLDTILNYVKANAALLVEDVRSITMGHSLVPMDEHLTRIQSACDHIQRHYAKKEKP